MLFVTLLALCCAACHVTAQVVSLEEYNVDQSKISTSGISAGACFATQLHVAESNKFMGLGMIAGIPYYCARAATGTALACMAQANVVRPDELIAFTEQVESDGDIDPLSNLADDRIYVFAGTVDTVVVPEVGPTIVEYYSAFMDSSNIYTKFDIEAEHGWPTVDQGTACDTQNSNNYINDCNYDSAYDMLNYIYGGGLLEPTSTTPLAGEFLEFDQSEFMTEQPQSISMDNTGLVYIPSGCVDKTQVCRLHVALHGCLMGQYRIGTDFHDLSGISHVGELNNIIILYPQAVVSAVNPNGCFDWWGYNDALNQADRYVKKAAPQIVAIVGMVDRLAGF